MTFLAPVFCYQLNLHSGSNGFYGIKSGSRNSGNYSRNQSNDCRNCCSNKHVPWRKHELKISRELGEAKSKPPIQGKDL